MDWMNALLEAAPQVGVSLGAGSAPFVGAILWGKLITLRHHNEALAEKDKQIAEVKANATQRETLLTEQLVRSDQALANEREAKKVERERADTAASKLNEVTAEFGATMVHMLGSFPQPSRGASDVEA
jgi:hypothetical protein